MKKSEIFSKQNFENLAGTKTAGKSTKVAEVLWPNPMSIRQNDSSMVIRVIHISITRTTFAFAAMH